MVEVEIESDLCVLEWSEDGDRRFLFRLRRCRKTARDTTATAAMTTATATPISLEEADLDLERGTLREEMLAGKEAKEAGEGGGGGEG